MDIVEVVTGERRYEIHIAAGVLGQLPALCSQAALKSGKTLVVTDENVRPLYGEAVKNVLEAAGWQVRLAVVPAGESAKTFAWAQRLYDEALLAGIDRKRPIMALGGGVVGDLAGFVAATFLRGVPFVQLPTTLLAQVDSSVGGKVAVNHPQGKNLIGAFYQPALVVIDPATLATLPRRELGAGYAEVVKYGLIDDADFFAWCEANGAALLAGDTAARAYAIAHSVAAKARIVAADERETQDIRALLNLGHSFGHALEAETGYSARLLHGEAVAAGMVLAHRFSAAKGLCSAADAERVRAHLASVDLPHSLASAGINIGGAALAAHMAHDKKVRGGKLPLILTRGIGQSFVTDEYGLDSVADFLDAQAA